MGPIRAESIRGIVQDLSPVENNLGVRIDAIVGFGILSTENFIIDYDSKKIVFGEQPCGWSFAGVMGISAFRLRQVAFDFERKLFTFRK